MNFPQFMSAKYLTRSLLLTVVAALTLTSCDSLLEVEPVDSASADTALQGRSGYSSLLNSAYDRLQGPEWYANQFMLEPEAQADNITVTNENSNRYLDPVATIVQSYMGTSDGYGSLWGQAYDVINDVNNIIATIDQAVEEGSIEEAADETAEAFRKRIKGQAYFLRALAYHDLMRTYSYEPGVQIKNVQGVVIRTEPTTTVEGAAQNLSRAPISDVYDLMISDLNQAASLLQGVSVNAPVRASRAAALALLSRVHLYAKNYAEAEQAATEAINAASGVVGVSTEIDGQTVPLVPGDQYVDAFTGERNGEGIFVLDMTSGQDGDATFSNQAIASLTIPGYFAFEVIPSQDPGAVANGVFVPANDDPQTDDLLGAFDEENDVRFGLFEAGQKGTQEFLYSRKWIDSENAYVTDIEILRTSELYLTRAEARYEQGDTDGAQSDLNVIRLRAGLDAVSPTGSELLEEILHQRRLEFNMEGQRWWDLKRRGMDIPKPQGVSPRDVIPYDARVLLAPLPTAEVNANPNLEQNPGY